MSGLRVDPAHFVVELPGPPRFYLNLLRTHVDDREAYAEAVKVGMAPDAACDLYRLRRMRGVA